MAPRRSHLMLLGSCLLGCGGVALAIDGGEFLGAYDPPFFVHYLDAEKIGAHTSGSFYGIAAGATHAHCGARAGGLVTLDISNPANPHVVHQIDLPGIQYEGTLLRGDVLYAARHDAGIEVLDVSDPAVPVPVTVVSDQIVNAYRFQATGDRLYVADGSGPSGSDGRTRRSGPWGS